MLSMLSDGHVNPIVGVSPRMWSDPLKKKKKKKRMESHVFSFLLSFITSAAFNK